MLKFIESSHKYFYNEEEIPSVSKLVSRFYVPFDKSVAKFVAKHRKTTEKVLLQEWEKTKNDALDLGNSVHDYAEDWANGKFAYPTRPQHIQFIDFFREVTVEKGLEIVDVEKRMFNPKYKYAGTTDLLAKDPKDGKYLVIDYKGLPLDTPIFTEDGWKTMSDLTYKDRVYDKDGNLVDITGISDVHYKPCMKITFDNNESIIADEDHRWLVTDTTSGEKVRTTKELYERLLRKEATNNSALITRVYNAKPLNNPHIDLPIDPYVLGVWLGDGHSQCGIITQANDIIWKEIERRGYELGKDVSGSGAGIAKSRSVFGLRRTLTKYGLINNKHIPTIYLMASYEQRLDLLRGIMDSDGYFNKHRCRFVMSTTRKSQAEWTSMLLGSLGVKPTIIKCKKFYRNSNKDKIYKDGYDVTFMTEDFNPFLLRNSDIDVIRKTSRHNYRIIKSIEKVDMVPTKCIEVNSPSSTYLFGKTFTVTHNTNKDLYKNYNKKMLAPFNKLIDCPINKYKIQLALYQMALQEEGFDIKERWIIWIKADSYEIIPVADYSKKLIKYFDEIERTNRVHENSN